MVITVFLFFLPITNIRCNEWTNLFIITHKQLDSNYIQLHKIVLIDAWVRIQSLFAESHVALAESQIAFVMDGMMEWGTIAVFIHWGDRVGIKEFLLVKWRFFNSTPQEPEQGIFIFKIGFCKGVG